MADPIDRKRGLAPGAPAERAGARAEARGGRTRTGRTPKSEPATPDANFEGEDEAEQVEFQAALQAFEAPDRKLKAVSLDAYLMAYITPNLSDPGILRANRSLSILERILSDVIPNLEGDEDLRSFAAGVIEDEIARRRDLMGRARKGYRA